MRAIFRVVQGDGSVGEIALAPGEAARVGSDVQWCDYAFEDPGMSAVHFLLYCDASYVYVRDLNSRGGTRRNGELVTTARLDHGDRITAGSTTLEVLLEKVEAGPAPPPEQTGRAASAPAPRIERLLSGLRKTPEPVFLLVDCARDGRILPLLGEYAAPAQTLFNGPNLGTMIPFSPHLVTVEKEGPLVRALLEEGWGQAWFSFVVSREPFGVLREHFRQLLVVEDPEGREVYFRYYDPRILRCFLPACSPAEARQFFGPVLQFWTEDENPEYLLQFAAGPKGVEMQRYSLAEPLDPAVTQPGARP
ncbi:MAG: DUF4123 domain-containing protein [Bryobacteraceae bacterium]|nr:DUF4123 domain-containing protein [Bryobacteraceae bacterium]MDW8378324.1 DUF4123 domain-containing protein [Bryobacterales bacterium]